MENKQSDPGTYAIIGAAIELHNIDEIIVEIKSEKSLTKEDEAQIIKKQVC